MYDLQQSINAAETLIGEKVGGDDSVTASSVSSKLSDVVTKTSALVETTSQAFSVVLDGAVEAGDVFKLTIGGTEVAYTVTSADVTASASNQHQCRWSETRLLRQLRLLTVSVLCHRQRSLEMNWSSQCLPPDSVAVTASITDSGESSGIQSVRPESNRPCEGSRPV